MNRDGADDFESISGNAARRGATASRLVVARSATAALVLGSTLVWSPSPLLVWNVSPSSPIGLYTVVAGESARADEMAIAWPPPGARRLAGARHYLPADVPLVKRVAAIADSRVCAKGRSIFIDGALAAIRRERDPSGRLLPWWSGCVRLTGGQLFLLSPRSPDAFDGRYFGITEPDQVIGRARLIWRA